MAASFFCAYPDHPFTRRRRLHATPAQVAFHFKRLMESVEKLPLPYLGREMFDSWQVALDGDRRQKEKRQKRRREKQEEQDKKVRSDRMDWFPSSSFSLLTLHTHTRTASSSARRAPIRRPPRGAQQYLL